MTSEANRAEQDSKLTDAEVSPAEAAVSTEGGEEKDSLGVAKEKPKKVSPEEASTQENAEKATATANSPSTDAGKKKGKIKKKRSKRRRGRPSKLKSKIAHLSLMLDPRKIGCVT